MDFPVLKSLCPRYFQLKKVRLRTTFASMDTSGAGVKLSCCEHYENVLYEYTNNEITAVNNLVFKHFYVHGNTHLILP